MACSSCASNATILAKASQGLMRLGNALAGKNGMVSKQAPSQDLSSTDSNVYGNPTARISSNGTNAKNRSR